MARADNDSGKQVALSSSTQLKSRVFKTKSATVSSSYAGHSGIDVTANGGYDYVVAHSAGTVVWVQTGYGNNKGSTGNASYGNAVKISHANGYATLYAHLSSVSVSNGQKVGKGQVLGYMGNSGNSYGAHLHFEVRTPNGSHIGQNARNYLNSDLPNLAGGGSSSGSTSGNSANSDTGTIGSGTPEKKTVEISKIVVKSVSGSAGIREGNDLTSTKMNSVGCEILIQNGGVIMMPVLVDEVTLEWSRSGSPGTLKFICAKNNGLSFNEGNPVSFRYNGKNVFFGYVFEKSRSDKYKIAVTVYDQLRYLKNKGTYAYANKKYSEVLQMIAKDVNLSCGTIEDTTYVIPKRIDDGTLFDILGNASDETLIKKGKLFVLYDEFGKLQLKNIESMMLPILIDEDTTGEYKYTTSIDKDVYNRVILASDNDETGERELYVANDASLQRKWGVLQHYDTMSGASSALLKETAAQLLKYHGKLRRTLTLNKVMGDIRVRGGSSVVVKFNLGDLLIQNYMVVEKVKHTFVNGLHTMNLDVSGIKGEFRT